jgi:hypothetical protein
LKNVMKIVKQWNQPITTASQKAGFRVPKTVL